jgi:hypothetical protein
LSPAQALRRKEWTLLLRDPWLMSQTLMQLLYLLPAAFLLWRNFYGGDGGASALLVPILIVSAGQLGGGLAWLAVSGEDAPELIASAPVSAARVLRAKTEGARRDRRDFRPFRRHARRCCAADCAGVRPSVNSIALPQPSRRVREAQAAGAKSLRQIAADLNARGIATARGGKWEAATVANVLKRAAASDAADSVRLRSATPLVASSVAAPAKSVDCATGKVADS